MAAGNQQQRTSGGGNRQAAAESGGKGQQNAVTGKGQHNVVPQACLVRRGRRDPRWADGRPRQEECYMVCPNARCYYEERCSSIPRPQGYSAWGFLEAYCLNCGGGLVSTLRYNIIHP